MKSFPLIVLLLIASFNCLAQDSEGSWQLGLLGGASFSKNRVDSPMDISYKVKSATGLSIQYQLTKFYVQANLVLENKGHYITYPGTPPGPDPSMIDRSQAYTVQFNRNYLTIPVMAGVSILQSNFSILLGPYVGVLLAASREERGGEKVEDDIDGKLDYGLAGGLAYRHRINSFFSLSGEVRHNYGISNISNGPIDSYINTTNLLLGLHYSLPAK
jgi:hypothetical protein